MLPQLLPAHHTAAWPARAWTAQLLAAALPGRPLDLGTDPPSSATLPAYLASPTPAGYIFDDTILDERPDLAAQCPPLSPPPPAASFPPIPRGAEGCYLTHITSFPALRPRWRWLLVGHPGAGFGMHVDPHATCAYNTLLAGRKRWALLPPSTPAPLAAPRPSESAAAWFRDTLPALPAAAAAQLLLLEQAPGETLLIPAGWWHVALTVGAEASVAVTANFLARGEFEGELAKLLESSPGAARAWAARVRAAGLPFTAPAGLDGV